MFGFGEEGFLFFLRWSFGYHEVEDFGLRRLFYCQVVRAWLRNVWHRSSWEVALATVTPIAGGEIAWVRRVRAGLVLASYFRVRLRR